MPITEKLFRLGMSAQRLNDGADRLNGLLEQIDETLGHLMIGLDYVHPNPLSETTSIDASGKRVIEVAYAGYLRVHGSYHLAIKTVKVLESKSQLASEQPGSVVLLKEAPRRLRYSAVDVLPELVTGLAAAVDDVVSSLEDRCATAEALLRHLQVVEGSDSHEANDPETRDTPPGRATLLLTHGGAQPGADSA